MYFNPFSRHLSQMNARWSSRSSNAPASPQTVNAFGVQKVADKIAYPYQVFTLPMDDQIELAYIDQGNGQETLLMIHGLGSYLPCWNKNVEGLKKHFRCLAVDLPGYGKSSKDDYPCTMDFYANVLYEFVQRMELPYVHLVGHSMGGQIAMTFALKYPELVGKLVLASPAGFESFSDKDVEWLRSVVSANGIKRASVREIGENIKYNFYQFPSDAEFMIQDRLNMRQADDFDWYCQSVARSVVGMAEQRISDYLGKIRQPTLVFFGENDNLIPNRFIHPGNTRELAEAGAQKIPQAELALLAQTGHFSQFEQAGAFNVVVTYFLQHKHSLSHIPLA
jgi:pimeloyl-ACP methyl ester carboxylesterase